MYKEDLPLNNQQYYLQMYLENIYLIYVEKRFGIKRSTMVDMP